MSTLGERIRCARENKGLFQGQLAVLIGVKSAGVISNWEKDINKPDAEKIVRLCEVLDVPASYLLNYYGRKGAALSLSEETFVEKYRSLSATGKAHVDAVLQWELDHAAELAAVRSSCADPGDIDIDAETEDYRRRLELEKKVGGKSGVSSAG